MSETGEALVATRVLRPFLRAMAQRTAPTIIDLGAAVGRNLDALAATGPCCVRFLDLWSVVPQPDTPHQPAALTADSLDQWEIPAGSVDGVLCWDVLDDLEDGSATLLAERVTHWLRPEGLVLAMFGTAAPAMRPRARYVIADADNLRRDVDASTMRWQRRHDNRHILRLFPRLRVTESTVLPPHTHEVLLRKPSYTLD